MRSKPQSDSVTRPIMMSLILMATLFPPLLFADLSVDEIMARVDSVEQGDTSQSKIEMILIDKRGKQRHRTMLNQTKTDGEDEFKLLFFTAPENVKGTGFLTHDYLEREDEQWLYLPALEKSKRIASADKSSSFMGSDFTYSDMTKRNINDYTYKLIQEKELNGKPVWVIETTPKTQQVLDNTGYTKSYIFVRQDNFVVIQALHLMDNNYRKYMRVKKLDQIDGIWVATELEMKTTKGKTRQHSTILRVSEAKFNHHIDDAMFTLRSLERGLQH